MSASNDIKIFLAEEDGAVTVDWVVLAAAVVGLGVAVLSAVTTGTSTASSTISTHMSNTTVVTSFP